VKEHVDALAALAGEAVLGGLVAYELDKLERAPRQLSIYDLGISAAHRRRGLATGLIEYVRDFEVFTHLEHIQDLRAMLDRLH
jgi:aminoglycoside 3-N-acetyltransferase I